MAVNGALIRIRSGRAERMMGGDFYALTPARSGGIYALRTDAILHVGDGSIKTVYTFDTGVTPAHGKSLVETAAGLWVGTRNHGVALVRDGRIEFFGTREGLSSGAPDEFFVDREGSVWVGTPLGLHRFREPLAYLLSAEDGLPPGMPLVVYGDSRGGLWISSSARTARIDLESHQIKSYDSTYGNIVEDKAGRIWLSSAGKVGFLRDRRFFSVLNVGPGDRIPICSLQLDSEGDVWALSNDQGLYKIAKGRAEKQEDSQGSKRFLLSKTKGLWIGLSNGRVVRILNGRRTVFGPESGLPGNEVLAIREVGDSLWFGSYKGLARWRNGKWTTWTVDHGLPGDGGVYEIATDDQNRFWLMTDGGILVVHRDELERTPDAQPRRFPYLRIGSLDRVLAHRGGIANSPRVTKGSDGRLFFATWDSIAVVDPARISEQSFIPPIVLETVLVNRRPLPPNAPTRFVAPEDIQFEYTSLSLRNPENVRFRYRLEGFDKDWVEAGAQRRAWYGALKPRSYRFRVIGSGSEGVWNETGAAYAFEVVAPFYETGPFVFALVGCVVASIWLTHRYRIRLATDRIRLRLAAREEERSRIARDIHDSFLQGIHGVSLALFAAMEKAETRPEEVRPLLDRSMEMVVYSTDQARKMLTALRTGQQPSEPLVPRLESMSVRESALHRSSPPVSIRSEGTQRLLTPEADEDVYLIASEMLRNALQHSKARNIRIEVTFSAELFRLSVADDGIGIPAEVREQGKRGHFGLLGIRERAARHSGIFTLDSSSSRGTVMTLTIPAHRAYSPQPTLGLLNLTRKLHLDAKRTITGIVTPPD
jgi:signal transduction histidine kinase